MPSPGGQCHQLKEPGSDFPVIANQSADWCGNPFPLQRPDFEHVTKEKTDCHVAALLAMTEVDGTLVLKLMTLPSGGRCPSAHTGADEGHTYRRFPPCRMKSTTLILSPFIPPAEKTSTFSPHPSRLSPCHLPPGGKVFDFLPEIKNPLPIRMDGRGF